ncbi:MAG: carboxylesterase family protein [Nitrospiraceae bacterium]|nr:carboxylesterase family protein [Nitrospiraceae bacterium]
MNRTWVQTALVCMAALAGVSCLTGCPDIPAAFDLKITTDVVYAVGNVSDGTEPVVWETKDLLLDVYEPVEKSAARPALLLVHGGSFTEGGKEKEEIVEFARYFAQRGYVSFAMSYRLDGDHPPAPGGLGDLPLIPAIHAAIVDVKAAARFIRANADAYGVDPDRIALLGESAGAIAAVPTAITNADAYSTDDAELPLPESNNPGVSPRVQAYIHLWGNADHVLLELDRSDPPIMIVHGNEDDRFGTWFATSERLHGLLEFYGMPHEFYEAKGFGHGAWDYRLRGKDLKRLVLDFLTEYMPAG